MTLSAAFSARFGVSLWRPAPSDPNPNLRVRAFAAARSTFETEAEVAEKLYAFEDQPLPGVQIDKRPANIGPLDAPPEMPGRWLHHCYERERAARWRWHTQRGAA